MVPFHMCSGRNTQPSHTLVLLEPSFPADLPAWRPAESQKPSLLNLGAAQRGATKSHEASYLNSTFSYFTPSLKGMASITEGPATQQALRASCIHQTLLFIAMSVVPQGKSETGFI